MVRVVKTEPDPSVVKQVICQDCGAKLEYVPNEVQSVSGYDYSGGSDGYTYVDCPNCQGRAVIRRW